MKKILIEKLKTLHSYFIKRRLSNMLFEIECELLRNISSKYREELIKEWNEINSRL